MTEKVVYLCDCYSGPQAGTEGQLLQLVRHLDRARYEPMITVLRSSDYEEEKLLPCAVRVLGITKLASLRSVFRIAHYAMTLRKDGCRLAHCFFNDTSMIAPFLFKAFGIGVLVSRRDMGFWYTWKNLLVLRLVRPFVDRYVANSQAVKVIVGKKEWVPTEKISVIYNGYRSPGNSAIADVIAARIPGVPDGAPVVGIVANLRPIKRMDILVRAFALCSKQFPEAYLVIVGDKDSKQAAGTLEELLTLVRGFDLRERVIFTGRVDDATPYIHRFAVGVLCSESEGFSNSVMEYMGAGRPIVCTDVGGNAEVVRDGYNGFLVQVGDSDALADRVLRLLSDGALARRLGEAGYETVRAYSYTRMVTEQMNCYDQVLSRAHRGLYRWMWRAFRC